MLRFKATFIFALLLVSLAGGVQAQSTPEELAEANRAAMDAYNNLDIEGAKRQLEDAARNAERNGVRGPALARTYANLGVVCVGGLSDNGAGLDAFVRALQQDPSITPDPLVSTPDIQQVFMLAQRKAAGGGGGQVAPTPMPMPVAPPPGPAARPMPSAVEGNLVHYPAMEQLTQTGVPIYVEVGDLSVARAQVMYRSLGMAKPKSLDMELMDDGGFGVVIPCSDVFEPKVEYFIVAFDDEGQQIGNAGTPQNPVSIPIVAQRSAPAPALPGQSPPAQCGGSTECPPGMPGCSGGGSRGGKGNGGLGDTCSSNADCGSGLVCDDDFCAIGERDDDDEGFGKKKKKKGKQPSFFFGLGFGLSGAYLGEDMRADTGPTPEVAATLKGKGKVETQELLSKAGWDCEIQEVDENNPRGGFTVENCMVALKETGFVLNKPLVFNAGYYFVPQAYIAVNARLMVLDPKGDGQLAGLAFGARIGYQMTQPKATGFHATLFAGGGAGQIQVRPKIDGSGSKGPFADSGLGMVQLGTTFGYRIIRNFGLVLSPTLNVMVPTRMFVLDGTLSAEVSF